MPAYCVAANCNNRETTPGITMHELPRNRPAVRRKWIKFIQFKRADFLAAPHHAHLCREHFSECDFANPMEYRMGSNWYGSNWYGCVLVGLSGKCQFRLRSSSWPFCSESPEWRRRHMVTWLIWASWRRFRYDRNCLFSLFFSRAFITHRSQFHLHHHSQRALTEIVSKITPKLGLVL